MSVFNSRDYYKPFKYEWAFEAYDMQQKMHWLPSEVPLHEDVNVRRLNNIHKRAWEKGLKTLYYCRSEAIKRAENISVKVERKVREDSIDEESCAMCQA